MDELTRTDLIKTGWAMHQLVEEALLRNTATRGSGAMTAAWREKQRLLLADMAIHLLQTALQPGDIALEKLRNNLHAILTISDRFLPDAGLQQATGKIHASTVDASGG